MSAEIINSHSFVVGLLVGVVSRVIRVKSPAPPIVALLGLFGMVLGKQAAKEEIRCLREP